MPIQRRITVVPYDARWPDLFQEEVEELTAILGEEIVAAHHIGSTAIPGMMAKPIIDVLLEVRDIDSIDGFTRDMIARGHVPKGEFGIRGRRFFIKGDEQDRTHHVHIFQTGNPEYERHLEFRDYLRSHSEMAQAYSRLKQELARRFPHDIDSYMAGKNDFIKEIERQARTWKRAGEQEDST